MNKSARRCVFCTVSKTWQIRPPYIGVKIKRKSNSCDISGFLIYLKWYYDQKIISRFLPILKAYSLNIQMAKFWALCFIRRLFILSVSFGFHGPPLLTLKTAR